MLDLFAIFTRGGALLWTLQFTALRHSPVEALNALIRSCLLEERSGDSTFTYVPKTGAHQALKWTFHNGLGLVFVAVYQKALSLMYVDELLAAVKQEFTTSYYKPNVMSYPQFNDVFNQLYKEAEMRAEQLRMSTASKEKPPAGKLTAAKGVANGIASGNKISAWLQQGSANGHAGQPAGTSDDNDEGDDDDHGAHTAGSAEEEAANGGGAFDMSKLAKATKGIPTGPRGRPAKAHRSSATGDSKKKDTKDDKAPKKTARTWGTLKNSDSSQRLDFSVDHSEYTGGSESDRATGGWSDVDGASGRLPAAPIGNSLMDAAVDDDADAVARSIQEAAAALEAAKSGSKDDNKPRGVLGSFMSSLAMRVVGKTSLSTEDLAPALADMKRKLMERNVAEEIAQNICDSVGRSLEGQKLASFTGVGAFVARAFEEALSGILNKRTTDMLLDIRKAQERGKPYVVVFCGVNGVGKSTNLAKIAYWLGQHGVKVLIAACDTFRAGAVEQLKTHCARLQVPLYERGYEKDPAKVAAEAIKQAEREGRHVVLVDTAGRMQDNEPLMRALSNLINVNSPNLVLFVGEALVGNDAVDQLVKFNRALHDLAPPTATTRHVIDGIVLTKFDTIDDKVGAAVSMVYASGAPVMFVGCGQTYADLKRLNVKSVVNSLLK